MKRVSRRSEKKKKGDGKKRAKSSQCKIFPFLFFFMSELVSRIRRKKRTEIPRSYFFEILFCTFGSCTISIDLGIISRERKKKKKRRENKEVPNHRSFFSISISGHPKLFHIFSRSSTSFFDRFVRDLPSLPFSTLPSTLYFLFSSSLVCPSRTFQFRYLSVLVLVHG